ncbi:MAG: ATP-dependent DNA helicase RecG [Bacilli bacterium]|nr:ATP-dependent DNA helicase RecG [Bacilli bacterium]
MVNDILLENEEYILTRYKNTLKKQGFNTVEDLLTNFPVRYENYTVGSIKDAKVDENIVLEGSVASKLTINYVKSKLSTLSFTMDVDGHLFRATIFNRLFLKTKLTYGQVIRVSGKFYKNLNNFTINDLIFCDEISRDIVPVYKIKEISEPKYLEMLNKVFHKYGRKLEETLPVEYINRHGLLDFKSSVKLLHYPNSLDEIRLAYNRLKYEELLKYQLSMKYLHYMREQKGKSPVMDYKKEWLDKLEESLSYDLTDDQKKAIEDILGDLKKPYAMNRLLQGEVGSGKTIVAVMAIVAVVSAGYQAALMCPTEILSQQHYATLKEMLKEFDINIALMTGSTTQKNRKEIIEGLKTGEINVVVGTHALFQSDLEYQSLGIVIADEEHRFGVRQRVMIRNKGEDVNYLKMSATPIPRTLSISVYGDMDISIIKQMPLNRKKVITKYVETSEKRAVMKHMKEELKNGHQIYVVTPLINESESLDTANATEIYENMAKYFDKEARVGLIHGKLKPNEKEDIMSRFLNKEIDILVATSVIEVGVNVVNATTILILGAERFGVATLHQLRGRVMRSDSVPYCFLLSEKKTETSEKRLRMLENTTDGFELAEYDLANRGPGEFFGEKQSGSMNFKYADLRYDTLILEEANKDADEIIKKAEFFESDEYQNLRKTVYYNYEMKQNQLD